MAAAPQAPGRGSVRKTRPLTVKTSLNNPYTLCWSALESEDMHFILQTLEDRFKSLGLKKIEDKKRKKKQPFLKKQSRDNCSTDVDVREDLKKQAEDTLQVSGWTPVHVRAQLAIGVNEVTRALHKTAFEPIHRHNSVTSVPSIKNVPFLENGKIFPLHQEIAKSLKIRGMCFLYPFIPPTNE